MSYILDISTAVPEFVVTNDELVSFYANAVEGITDSEIQKLRLLSAKTKISTRYSCIPDFSGNGSELFSDDERFPSVEKRMEVYTEKLIPLASKAIDKILFENNLDVADITHLITVSCTGLFSPGFEFLIAEKYEMQHAEKIGFNFLGCYAALKAIKHAHYIAEANPEACVLIVCAELCSLHFNPTMAEEDIIANLLFSDGAAAVVICGKESSLINGKVLLAVDAIGTGHIPDSLQLMTWNISSKAFSMFLSKEIVPAIRNEILSAVSSMLTKNISDIDFWAIHPGGVRIVEAVKESLDLSHREVATSLKVLEEYGNMSSPTILFILEKIFQQIKNEQFSVSKNVFSCAFGPGLNVEMIQMSSVLFSSPLYIKKYDATYAIR